MALVHTGLSEGQGGEGGLEVKPSLAYIRSLTSHLDLLIS